MILLDFEKPTHFDLIGDMRVILAWMRAGYRLFARKVCSRLEVWADAPSPKALDLNPADAARLLTRGLIEEDPDASTDATTAYRLTDAGREAGR